MENEIQTGSSGSLRNRNYDGSISVHCRQCKQRICDVDGRNTFYSAICVMCQKAEEGVVVSAEVENQLRTVKMPGGREFPVGVLQMQPSPVAEPDKWFKAIMAVAKKVVVKTKNISSKDLAKEKKRKPILTSGFEINVNPDATFKDSE